MPSEQAIDKLFDDSKKLFKRKLADYGTQDITEMGKDDVERMLTILKTRLNEKRLRAINILEKRNCRVLEEPCRDAFMDGIGYNAILCFLCDGIWDAQEGISVEPEAPGEHRYESAILKANGKLLVKREKEAREHPLPSPKKVGDVGHDLTTVRDTLIPYSMSLPTDVPTGIRIKLPENHWALVINRSSTARKLGLDVVNGVIDNGYTGELFACCWNRTGHDILIPKGTRLAQFVVFQSIIPDLEEVEGLPATERGESGFGSTDEKV